MSLFDSKTKILFFSDNDYEKISNLLYSEELISHYFVEYGQDGLLQAKDINKKIHTFNAPANGAVLLIKSGTTNAEMLKSVLSLWDRAGLDEPNIFNIENIDELELCKNIYALLINDLHRELLVTAEQSVNLDRQIAALREELENLRLESEGTNFSRRLAGEQPTLSYERLPNNFYWDMGMYPCGKQLLPYSGNILSAIAIYIEDINTLKNGLLTASIIAREDDKILDKWELDESLIIHEQWLLLKIKERIPYRYRYIDLTIEWHGSGMNAPQLGLANAYGDKEAYVDITDFDNQDTMLALKVWSGTLFDNNSISKYMHYDTKSFVNNYTVKIPQKTINNIQKVVDREFDHRWLTTENNNILLHPTLEGPSIVYLYERWSGPVKGISTLLTISNYLSPAIAFSIIISRKELSEKVLGELADGNKKSGEVDVLPWKKILPGTDVPIDMMFTTPSKEFLCYFLTRVDGKSVDNAHSWFKDLKYIL